MTNADPGAFMVMLTMNPGLGTRQAEKVIEQEIEQIKKTPISSAELQKVKNQTMVDYMEGLTTIDGKAQALAINEILFHDYSRLFSDLEKYNAVTAEEIQVAVKKYLQPQRKVVGILEPRLK
jgi:zinc protease